MMRVEKKLAEYLQDEDMRELFRRILDFTERRKRERPDYEYAGWFEWYDVAAPTRLLNKLVIDGILEIPLKTNRSTFYRLKNPEMIRKALEDFEKTINENEPSLPEEEKLPEIPSDLFEIIEGYDRIKKIFIKSIKADRPVHILLVGPPAAGKSTPGYTEIIVLSNKGLEIVRMDKLYERVKRGEKLYALSINPITLKAEWKKITDAYRHKPDERLLKIKTRSGRSVVVTEGHSLLQYSFEEGKLVPIMAKELRKGDAIPVLKKFMAPEKKDLPARPLPLIGFLIGAWLAEGSVTTWKKDLITEMTNSDSEFLDKCCMGLRILDPGFKPRKKKGRKRTVRTYRKRIAKFFMQFLDAGFEKDRGKGRCSRHKIIPSWVYCTPDEFRRELIKGYMFGDGRKKDLTFGSVSRKLRDGICLLLNQFGIIATRRERSIPTGKYYEGNVIAGCYDEYAEKIGFFKTRRPKGLGIHEEIYRVPVRECHVRKGLLGIGIAKKLLQHLEKVVNADVFWDVVEKIEVLDGKEEYVYDISVEGNENFVCVNGIVLHNSLFLMEIERLQGSVMTTASSSTKAGIRDVLLERKPRFLLIDELEKINDSRDLSVLLTLMESQRLIITKHKQYVDVPLKCWVFAAANSVRNLPEELLSRFLVFELKPYTEEQFRRVVTKVLVKRENKSPELAKYIADRVLSVLKSRDVRDAIKIARLSDTREDVDFMVETMSMYSRS